MSLETDQRRFTRIDFETSLDLIQGNDRLSCELVDVSLKGILVTEPDNGIFDADLPTEAVIELSPDVTIRMQVQLAHQRNNLLGFICISIDLDSTKHLRRLIELNIGNDNDCVRELHECASHAL